MRAFSRRLLLLALTAGWLPVAQAAPVVVRSVPLTEVLETSFYSAPASVVARNTPQVAAEISASVTALPVRVGDLVQPGDELAHLDCRRHESRLASARAAQARAETLQRLARRQLDRARNLQKNQSISDELLDQRRTELAVSEADALVARESAQQAELDVQDCVVRSPLAGVVSERLVSVGSHVTPGTVLIALIETVAPEVTVALRQDQLASFTAATERTFEHDGEVLPLALRSVLPAADTVSRTREARLTFTVTAAVPGTAGRVVWGSGQAMIPADYLVRRDGELGIFVLDGDRARFIALPGAQEGRSAASPALPEDLHLITEGRQRLSDAEPVQPVAGP
jgi:RND family efflux transporter MFP subunit